jgi:hypothetical protein
MKITITLLKDNKIYWESDKSQTELKYALEVLLFTKTDFKVEHEDKQNVNENHIRIKK